MSSIIFAFDLVYTSNVKKRKKWSNRDIPGGKRERERERENEREPPLDLDERERRARQTYVRKRTDGGPVILNGRRGRFLGY